MGEPSSFTKDSPKVHLPAKTDEKSAWVYLLREKDTQNRPFEAYGEPFCSRGEPLVKDEGSPIFRYHSIFYKEGETLKLTMEKRMVKRFEGME